MSKGVKIGKAGLNPTIPLCPYCNEPKNEILLTGLAGEKAAKKAGHTDGHLPMHIHVAGDFVPCDKCKEKGIAIVEVDKDRKPTGCLWLIKEEVILEGITSEEAKERVKKDRVAMVPEDITKAWGLHDND